MKKLFAVLILTAVLVSGCTSRSNVADNANTPEDTAKIPADITNRPSIFPLSQEENEIYQQYSKTRDDQILRYQPPVVICRLYFQAEKLGDVAPRYSLYIQGDKYGTPAYQQFLSDLRSDTVNRENTAKLIKRFEEDTKLVQERNISDNQSVVEIMPKSKNDSLLFRVVRNDKGIWKVDWLPLQ